MDSRLIGELATNDGLVTRQRALQLGLDPAAFDRLVRAGELTRVRRGVYCLPSLLATATRFSDRQRLADRAACLRVPPPFVRSHTTAALEQGLGVLLPGRPVTHVTQHRHGIRGRWGVKHHIAPYRDDQVVAVNGFQVLEPVRTSLDIAREYGHPYGVVAIDRVRWLGHPVEEFEAVLSKQMRSWPYVVRARRELDLSNPGAESVAETLGRTLVDEVGFIDVETQFGLTDGRVTHFADLRIGRHLVEIDGDGKYLGEGIDSADVRATQGVILDEKRREDWFRAFHLGMSRLTWRDVWGPGREAAKARILREKARTDRLWGTAIDDLERFRVVRTRRAA
jgi:hypothetical protein